MDKGGGVASDWPTSHSLLKQKKRSSITALNWWLLKLFGLKQVWRLLYLETEKLPKIILSEVSFSIWGEEFQHLKSNTQKQKTDQATKAHHSSRSGLNPKLTKITKINSKTSHACQAVRGTENSLFWSMSVEFRLAAVRFLNYTRSGTGGGSTYASIPNKAFKASTNTSMRNNQQEK